VAIAVSITRTAAADAQGRQEAECQAQAGDEFGEAEQPRVGPATTEAERVEEAGRAVNAVATEHTEHLLGTVAGEGAPGHQTQNEQPNVHGLTSVGGDNVNRAAPARRAGAGAAT
jgi:hypothetical protein